MNKQDKVHYVINTLEGLYPKTPIPLDHKDPYTLLIAVLLSAQCTDERVNKITPKLFGTFPLCFSIIIFDSPNIPLLFIGDKPQGLIISSM